MKLRDIVVQKAIVSPLKSTKRDDAIRELVDALAAAGAVRPDTVDELAKAVIKREKKGSTGFGHGVAAPHVKTPDVQRVFAAVGISTGGLEFQALDKQLVHVVFLLLSPEEKPEEHIDAMECIFGVLTQDKFRRFLRQAKNAAEVWALLEEADSATEQR
jgi:PTS system fructose-specific IIA component/PTS system nitrogen regulatory IIA component